MKTNIHHHHHYHHHVPEGLGVFPVPWSSKLSWSLHLFFGRPMFLRPFGLYHNAPTSTKAKVAWPLGNAAETAADGRGCRRKSSVLKLGLFN